MKKDKGIHTLLVIRTSALGDVAMTLPVIYPLARQYPHVRIVFLTQAPFARLLVAPPANIVPVTADWKGRHRGILGLLRLAKELSAIGISAVADFHNVPRSWAIDFLLRLKGIPVHMVDKGRRKRRMLTRLKGKKETAQRPYILRYADVLEKSGLPVNLDFASLYDPSGNEWPAEIPSCGRPRIGIAPFARFATKTYPAKLMEQVVADLTRKGYSVFLFGGTGQEKQQLSQWAGTYGHCVALPGLLPIEEELLLMSRLDVMLTMDSANMHLASLAGIPVVSVWGSTTPQCGFLGWRQKESHAVCLHLPCQPCSISGRPDCPLRHFACMASIPPKMITAHIETILQEIRVPAESRNKPITLS